MDEICYVHAADLHLDTPFSGLDRKFAPWADQLRRATFTALDRLRDLCLLKQPDFLVLAGDIYNQEEGSIKAQLQLRDMCAALDKRGIPVFMVHGNHDPYSSRFTSIQWPDNTFIFGPAPQTLPVSRNGYEIALIHGASHASDREERNLAALLSRNSDRECFQLGLLHCNVDHAVVSDRYAPCSLADLQNSGLDAWALGHAHARRILCQTPFIAYAGNLQGLHCSETGPKGCLEVKASRCATGWQCEARFHALGPVQWQKAVVDLENAETIDETENRMAEALQNAPEGEPDGLIVDMLLTGRTSLAPLLGQKDVLEELANRLQPFSAGPTAVLLRDISVDAAPLVSEAENLERDDLLGEISRLAKSLSEQPEELNAAVRDAIAPLARACRNILPPPDAKEQEKLLARARRLCQDMLERR